jgi:hypothetical protein
MALPRQQPTLAAYLDPTNDVATQVVTNRSDSAKRIHPHIRNRHLAPTRRCTERLESAEKPSYPAQVLLHTQPITQPLYAARSNGF